MIQNKNNCLFGSLREHNFPEMKFSWREAHFEAVLRAQSRATWPHLCEPIAKIHIQYLILKSRWHRKELRIRIEIEFILQGKKILPKQMTFLVRAKSVSSLLKPTRWVLGFPCCYCTWLWHLMASNWLHSVENLSITQWARDLHMIWWIDDIQMPQRVRDI